MRSSNSFSILQPKTNLNSFWLKTFAKIWTDSICLKTAWKIRSVLIVLGIHGPNVHLKDALHLLLFAIWAHSKKPAHSRPCTFTALQELLFRDWLQARPLSQQWLLQITFHQTQWRSPIICHAHDTVWKTRSDPSKPCFELSLRQLLPKQRRCRGECYGQDRPANVLQCFARFGVDPKQLFPHPALHWDMLGHWSSDIKK